MGIVFGTLWQRLFGAREYKICIIGLSNAGKTTTLYKLHLGEVISTKPTIGSNVEEVEHNNVKLSVWDLGSDYLHCRRRRQCCLRERCSGGQESLRSTWTAYFANTHAIVMVVDSTDRKRISIVKKELFRILQHESLKAAVLLVFANKQDVDACMKPAEIATALELTSIRDHQWHIQGCCALTGAGLYEGLDWITSKIATR